MTAISQQQSPFTSQIHQSTSIVVTYPTTTAGNTISVAFIWGSNGTLTLPSGWAQITFPNGSGQTTCFAYLVNCPGNTSPVSYTFTLSGNANCVWIANEWLGTLTASVVDQSVGATASGTSITTGTTPALAGGNELGYWILAYNNNAGIAASSPTNGYGANTYLYTTAGTGSKPNIADFYNTNVGAGGATTASGCTLGSTPTGNISTLLVVLKPLTTSISLTDTGSGSDAESQLNMLDPGTGTDTVVATMPVAASDSGTGADSQHTTTINTVTWTEQLIPSTKLSCTLLATLTETNESVALQAWRNMLRAQRDYGRDLYQPQGLGAATDQGIFVNWWYGSYPHQANYKSVVFDIQVDPITGYATPKVMGALPAGGVAAGTLTSLTLSNLVRPIQSGTKFCLGYGATGAVSGAFQFPSINCTLASGLTNGTQYASVQVNTLSNNLIAGQVLQMTGNGGHASQQIVVSANVAANAGVTTIPVQTFTANYSYLSGGNCNLYTGVQAGPVVIPIASLVTTQSYSGNVVGPLPPDHDPATDLRYLQSMRRYKHNYPSDTEFDADLARYTTTVQAEWSSSPNDSDTRGWLYFIFAELWDLTGDTNYKTIMTDLVTAYSAFYHTISGIPGGVNAAGSLYYIDPDSTTDRANGYLACWETLECGCALYDYGTRFSNATYISQGRDTINFIWWLSECQVTGGGALYNISGQNIAGITNGSGAVNTNPNWDSTIGDANTTYPGSIGLLANSLLRAYLITSDTNLSTIAQTILDQLDYTRTTLPSSTLGPGMWDTSNLGYIQGMNWLGTGPKAVTGTSFRTSQKESGRQSQTMGGFFIGNLIFANRYATQYAAMLYVTTHKEYNPQLHGSPYIVNADWTYQTNPPLVTSEAVGILGNAIGQQDVPVLNDASVVMISKVILASPDVASGADVLSEAPVQAPITGTGSGTDVLTLARVALPLSDAAAGGDTPAPSALVIQFPIPESGLASDVPTLGPVSVALADTGAGTDTPLIQFRTVPVPTDSASASDAMALVGAAQVPIADTGAGQEGITYATIQISLNEAAHGAETLLASVTAPLPGDTAGGTDAMALSTMTLTLQDAATGAELQTATISLAPPTDTGQGGESIGWGAHQTLSVNDGATGGETIAFGPISVAQSDGSVGGDAIRVFVPVTLSENANGAELVAPLVGVALTDRGSGTDPANIAAFVPLSVDAATASDALALSSVQAPLGDAATGNDAQLMFSQVTIPLSDAALAAERLSIFVTGVNFQETASGAESLVAGPANLVIADAATGQELMAFALVAFPVGNAATGSETLSLSLIAVNPATERAAGADLVTTQAALAVGASLVPGPTIAGASQVQPAALTLIST